MKCTCCGKDISTGDKLCPHCGENNEDYVNLYHRNSNNNTTTNTSQTIKKVPIYSYNNTQNNSYTSSSTNNQQYTRTSSYPYLPHESAGLGVCAIVFSALGGWLGLVLSIIGLSTYKNAGNRAMCKVGLGICIGWFVFGFIIGLALL